MEQETGPLLDGSSAREKEKGSLLLRNFLIMATCFGFSHGSVTVALAYATSVFDLRLGSYSTGFVYSTYTLSALLFATPVVQGVGARQALLITLGCYFIYLICFVVASGLESATWQWVLVIIGSLCGGFSSGIGWVAQGTHYAVSASCYAKEESMPPAEVNDTFASYFGFIYVGSQCLLYLSSSLLFEFTAFEDDDLFIVYAGIALASFIGLALFLGELEPAPDDKLRAGEDVKLSTLELASAAVQMTFTNPRALLLLPLGIVFGFAGIFVSSYVNDETVSAYIGTYGVGYCGVIQTATIALLSVPFGKLASVAGKGVCLAIGCAGYIALTGVYIGYTNKELGHWDIVAPVYISYGVGRLSFEVTTKAVFADFFVGADRTPSYANLNSVVGLTATVYSFIISDLDRIELAILVLVPALLMVPGYLLAKAIPSEI